MKLATAFRQPTKPRLTICWSLSGFHPLSLVHHWIEADARATGTGHGYARVVSLVSMTTTRAV